MMDQLEQAFPAGEPEDISPVEQLIANLGMPATIGGRRRAGGALNNICTIENALIASAKTVVA